MNFKENIQIAIFSIKTNLMRSLLTMLGIIIGVSSVIAIITVGNGGRDHIVGLVREMGQNVVAVQVDPQADANLLITQRDVRHIRALDHVTHASPQIMSWGPADTAYAEGLAAGVGGNPDLQHIMGLELVAGRFFTDIEYDSAARVALIPRVGAEMMFGTTNMANVVGQHMNMSITRNQVRVRIIGVVDLNLMGGDGEELGGMVEAFAGGMIDGNMTLLMIPSTVMHEVRGVPAAYDNIQIVADDERNLDFVGQSAASYLYIAHGAPHGTYNVMNMATYIDLLDSIINILTTFIAGVSGISLVVGGIGVMNIMLVSVTERTREIGIRKALGAKTGTILLQFLTESVILCLIGGAIGFIIGVAIAAFVASFIGIPIAIRVGTIAIAVGFSSAIGIFFGIYPARRAARMLPIEALRRD